MGNLRLLAVAAVVVGIWQQWNSPGPWWIVLTVVGLFIFFNFANRQRQAGKLRDIIDASIAVNKRAISRLNHDWDHLPVAPDSGADRTHPYAYDLNIVGPASLAQRIGTPATQHGWQALYSSLLTERDLTDLIDRQDAVNELADKLMLRQQVESVAITTGEHIPDPQPLTDWAAEDGYLGSRPWLRWLAQIGPVLVVIAVLLWLFDVFPWFVILAPLTFNGLIFFLMGSPVANRVQQVVPIRDAVSSYGHVMDAIASDDPEESLLRVLDERLSGGASAMNSLARLVNFAIPQGSMLYYPLQMTLMWDINVLARLESWRDHHGSQVNNWLDAMGEWEALAALAVLAHDHHEWVFPEIDEEATGLFATQLAHPLLTEDIAIANDVEISPRGTFLFVTGSNMSGKSTLLRAIGVNAVLAHAGAPVAAKSLRMPPLEVSCCMRVEDSLAQGVSFFMAELRRLKSVIDRAKSPAGRTPLYLLDEILQGTNTAERQIASRYVLQQLASLPAIGAVSSHDLELIDDTELEKSAIAVHFAEQFSREGGEAEMTFDYQLRPGLATSSNAIRLMEIIGFEIPG